MDFLSNVKDPRYLKRISLFNDVAIKVHPVDDSLPPAIHLKTTKGVNQVNPQQLMWLPWMWYQTTTAGSKALEVCDYLGESLAWFFGITSPKFQYEINEFNEMKKKDADRNKANISEKKLLYFSNGPLQIGPRGDLLPPDVHLKTKNWKSQNNREHLTWLQWAWYGITITESKALKAIDNFGELLAWFFGITTPMYQYEMNEYLQMKKEDSDYMNNILLINYDLMKKHPMDYVSTPEMDLKKKYQRNREQLTWSQWLWDRATTAGSKILEICDDLGEWLAAFFGITTPKFQYEINEYIEMKEREYKEARGNIEFGFLPYKYNPNGYKFFIRPRRLRPIYLKGWTPKRR